ATTTVVEAAAAGTKCGQGGGEQGRDQQRARQQRQGAAPAAQGTAPQRQLGTDPGEHAVTLRVTGPAHRRSTIVVDADRMGRRGRDRARPPRGQEAAAAAGALEEPLAAASAEEPES